MTTHKYKECNERHPWIKEMKKILSPLFRKYRHFSQIIWRLTDSKEILPIRFLQYDGGILLIYKRDYYTFDLYREIMRIFAFQPDLYYRQHQNYSGFLEGIASIQSQNANIVMNACLDIVDMYYMCTMAGKYADRFKEDAVINREVIGELLQDIQEGYNAFIKKPFFAIESALVFAVLKHFYKCKMDIKYPKYQSGNIILHRVEDLTKKSALAFGHQETLKSTNKFFGIATAYLNTSVNDILMKLK